jgi:hypothetical protein
MKRIASAIAVALAVAFVAAGAPAHSSRPVPVDFEMAAPAAPHTAGGGVVSTPLRAPQRFDVVGLRWSGRAQPHVHIRARSAGENWTKWRELPVDGDGRRGFTDPAWAGGARYVQYRLSRPVSGLRLHFVRTLGTTPTVRAKAAGQPAIVPRSGWNADQCKPRSAPQYGQVKLAFVHHTVTLNDYSADESPAIVLAICRYHRNSNGWNDLG